MGSLQGDDEVLDTTAWPDATGPALIENSARGIVVATLVYADNCAMDAVGLQSVVFHTAFGDVSVLENNPWLAEYFPADPKKINDWGGAAVNGSDEERLEAAKLCAHVGAIWEQLTDMGVMENITTELPGAAGQDGQHREGQDPDRPRGCQRQRDQRRQDPGDQHPAHGDPDPSPEVPCQHGRSRSDSIDQAIGHERYPDHQAKEARREDDALQRGVRHACRLRHLR